MLPYDLKHKRHAWREVAYILSRWIKFGAENHLPSLGMGFCIRADWQTGNSAEGTAKPDDASHSASRCIGALHTSWGNNPSSCRSKSYRCVGVKHVCVIFCICEKYQYIITPLQTGSKGEWPCILLAACILFLCTSSCSFVCSFLSVFEVQVPWSVTRCSVAEG